jgi:hypothetical protein
MKNIYTGSGGEPSRKAHRTSGEFKELYDMVESAIPSGENTNDGWYYIDVRIVNRADKRKRKSVLASAQGSIRNAIMKYHPGYKPLIQTVDEDADREHYGRIWFKVVQK